PEPGVASLPPLQPRRAEPQDARAFAAPASREPAPAGATARAPMAPRSAPSPRPAAVAEAAAPQGGWVSDLLRRASREEEEFAPRPAPAQSQPQGARTPLHVVESLNSLSMDIARAIDHDAFIELWDRYQRGERNAFTRRLYTLQGEQTFDEIRSKYGREPEFRSAVDRYITDFEKLLADVSRNDRDNMMTQTYLSSDTGKVYTMLAHAAGRFSS
nr:kinesin [Nitratireductor sp.]